MRHGRMERVENYQDPEWPLNATGRPRRRDRRGRSVVEQDCGANFGGIEAASQMAQLLIKAAQAAINFRAASGQRASTDIHQGSNRTSTVRAGGRRLNGGCRLLTGRGDFVSR